MRPRTTCCVVWGPGCRSTGRHLPHAPLDSLWRGSYRCHSRAPFRAFQRGHDGTGHPVYPNGPGLLRHCAGVAGSEIRMTALTPDAFDGSRVSDVSLLGGAESLGMAPRGRRSCRHAACRTARQRSCLRGEICPGRRSLRGLHWRVDGLPTSGSRPSSLASISVGQWPCGRNMCMRSSCSSGWQQAATGRWAIWLDTPRAAVSSRTADGFGRPAHPLHRGVGVDYHQTDLPPEIQADPSRA